MPEVLPRPTALDDGPGTRGPELWIDEAIWGHRLHDEQTPWLAFLEFLTVLDAENRAGRALAEPAGPNTLRYQPNRMLHLRNVLFNNPRLLALPKESPDEESRWAQWLEDMAVNADGLGQRPNFGYVRSRFSNFEDFVATVQLMRSTAIEGDSNKRWSSKFVFPYGPSAFYEDLNVKPNSMTNDRRFFGRVGELVYLMLSRSGHAAELLEHLRPLVLSDDTAWNRLVRAFTPRDDDDRPSRGNSYLPYASLPEFATFAQDWLSVLRCRMPGYDGVPHLVDLLGLHVLLYKLRCAQRWIDPSVPVRLVLEVIAPKRTTIRDLASETYLENNHKSREAIDQYIRRMVDEAPEWQQALSSTDPFGEGARVMRSAVGWPDRDSYEGAPNPQSLRTALGEAAMRRHAGHVGNVHARYAAEVGLASRRGTRRIRYAPNDQLLGTLVLAVVPRRMEFQQFLSILYERYGFVIGHRQAQSYIDAGQSDQKAFEDNARRLELRLVSLGLLRRLSDACAYVENPFATGGR